MDGMMWMDTLYYQYYNDREADSDSEDGFGGQPVQSHFDSLHLLKITDSYHFTSIDLQLPTGYPVKRLVSTG